jgi:hypothetical protein
LYNYLYLYQKVKLHGTMSSDQKLHGRLYSSCSTYTLIVDIEKLHYSFCINHNIYQHKIFIDIKYWIIFRFILDTNRMTKCCHKPSSFFRRLANDRCIRCCCQLANTKVIPPMQCLTWINSSLTSPTVK